MENSRQISCPFGHAAVTTTERPATFQTISGHSEAPIADWVDLAEMKRDPYPIYQRLREETPVAWIPGLNRYLITSFQGCHEVESNQEIYTAQVGGGMVKAMGARPMLRKDDPDHAADRKPINPVLRPKNLKQAWSVQVRKNTEFYLDELRSKGPSAADLNLDFAAPLAAKNLIDLLGMRGVQSGDMQRWSRDFIDGIANVQDDPEVWERCENSRTEVDDVLEDLMRYYRQHPGTTMISALTNSGIPAENVKANVKLTISGGVNEPNHMITNMVWALDQHPAQRDQVLQNESLWESVFNETVRWISPIGMAPRETTRATVLEGVMLPAHAPVGLGFASANRDRQHFTENPDLFDLFRPREPHLAFGSGPHICAGQWAARIAVGQIALPLLYQELPDLRIDTTRPLSWEGWVFRGITTCPVTWS